MSLFIIIFHLILALFGRPGFLIAVILAPALSHWLFFLFVSSPPSFVLESNGRQEEVDNRLSHAGD
jgi:hypothetical protein